MRLILFFALCLPGFSAAAETQTCVFCEIVAGTREAAIVYRDASVLVFMDHAPRNPGHVLIVPVKHAENLLELPEATARDMMAAARKIARAIRRTDLKAEGLQLQMNTGKAAGQSVFHAHLHIIPRYAGEPDAKPEKPTSAELEAVAAKIRAQLE